jgi:hypothetical protein
MKEKTGLIDRIYSTTNEIEKYQIVYRFLIKCEQRKLKHCMKEYQDLSIDDFVEYYKENDFEVVDQVEKYEKELERIKKEKKKIYNQTFLKKYGKEAIENYRKKYYQNHAEELKKYNRERANNNKQQRKEYAKKWNKNNPDKRKAYNEKWRAEHPDYYKEYYKKLKGDK